MATLRRKATRRAARPPNEPVPPVPEAAEWDEALLLEQTGGFLTALPHESTEDEWDMPALIKALKAGEVQLPLTEAEERRFRRRTAGEPR